jgi:hypothetical protein
VGEKREESKRTELVGQSTERGLPACLPLITTPCPSSDGKNEKGVLPVTWATEWRDPPDMDPAVSDGVRVGTGRDVRRA